MNIGKLRHRVVIEHFTTVRLPTGTVREDWSPFATRWASIEPIRGREYWAAAQTQAEVTHTIRMRFTDGVTPDMRIRYGERIFEIVVVRNLDEENRITEILAMEKVVA